VIADLDTLLTALCVELTDRIIPALGLTRHGPAKPSGGGVPVTIEAMSTATVSSFLNTADRLGG
jgi:hypothetical protein